MDSWKFVLEIHWTWSELYGFDCSISGVFSGRIGIGRFSWALQDPAGNHPLLVTRMEPHGIPVVPTCLFPTLVGSGLSWLYFGWRMEAIGRRWSLMNDRSVILSMLVCRDVNTPRFRPWVAVKTSGLSPQALRWTISIPYHQQHVFWLGVHGPVGVHGQVGVHG